MESTASRTCCPSAGRLVLRGSLDVIDDQEFASSSVMLEFQAELLLQRGKEGRWDPRGRLRKQGPHKGFWPADTAGEREGCSFLPEAAAVCGGSWLSSAHNPADLSFPDESLTGTALSEAVATWARASFPGSPDPPPSLLWSSGRNRRRTGLPRSAKVRDREARDHSHSNRTPSGSATSRSANSRSICRQARRRLHSSPRSRPRFRPCRA